MFKTRQRWEVAQFSRVACGNIVLFTDNRHRVMLKYQCMHQSNAAQIQTFFSSDGPPGLECMHRGPPGKTQRDDT
jgi:hypothetical protein